MSKNQSIDVKKPWAEKYFLFMVGFSVVFWAVAFPLIAVALTELSPENLAILRLSITSLIFLGYYLLRPSSFTQIQKKDFPWLFLLGFFGISVYHLGLNYGEQYVSAGTASLIIATIPLFVVILSSLFLSEKITKKTATGIIVSLFGVVIISLWGTPGVVIEITYLSAAAAVLLSSIVGAIYTVVGKAFVKRYNPISLTTYAFLFGTLGVLLFLRPLFFEQVTQLSWQGWTAVLFLSIFPTAIAYTFWYVCLQVKPASELTVYLYFIPVLSTLVSCLFLGESITIFYVFGGFLVILGLYFVNKKQSKNQGETGKK